MCERQRCKQISDETLIVWLWTYMYMSCHVSCIVYWSCGNAVYTAYVQPLEQHDKARWQVQLILID
jgi:hypothetical protein